MPVADDALAETFDVALLIRNQATPGLRRSRLVPAVDRPLGRLGAVVVAQRLPAQSIARIARQISGHVSRLPYAGDFACWVRSIARGRGALQEEPVAVGLDGQAGAHDVPGGAEVVVAPGGGTAPRIDAERAVSAHVIVPIFGAVRCAQP